MKVKIARILLMIIMIIFIIGANISVVNAENTLNEYEQRKQEAENIINNVNPKNENESYYKEYVYVAEGSAKYHYYGCSELTSTPHKIEKSTAINNGYYACEKCNPFNIENSQSKENRYKDNNTIIFILFIIIGILIIYIIINEIRYKKKNINK